MFCRNSSRFLPQIAVPDNTSTHGISSVFYFLVSLSKQSQLNFLVAYMMRHMSKIYNKYFYLKKIWKSKIERYLFSQLMDKLLLGNNSEEIKKTRERCWRDWNGHESVSSYSIFLCIFLCKYTLDSLVLREVSFHHSDLFPCFLYNFSDWKTLLFLYIFSGFFFIFYFFIL